MKSLVALSILVYLASHVVAEPAGRFGHAFPDSVHTGNEETVSINRRRVGYAAGPKVVSPGDSGKSAHRQRTIDAHGAKAPRAKPPPKSYFSSPLPARAVSMPLYKAGNHAPRADIHPAMSFQQRLNQGHRRFAHFLGRSVSDADLVDRLKKRADSLNLDFQTFTLQKRGHPFTLETRAPDAGAAAGSAGFSKADLDALNGNTVTKANPPTDVNSIGLDIESADVGYFSTVEVGTPGQEYSVLMDSGSADFWLPGEFCVNSKTNAETCGHKSLGPKVSSTFKALLKSFSVTYGTGNVQGGVISDDVKIAGLSLKSHTFGVATAESDDFANAQVPFDGLMGLARSSISEQRVPTPIEALAAAGTVPAPVMGYALGRVADGVNTGQITFGGVDKSRFSGDLTEFDNINPQGFWEGKMDDVTVNGKSLKLSDRQSILDTGTTLIIAPEDDAKAVHAAIPGAKSDGQGGFTIPCTTTAKVALVFAGKSFEINPIDLTVQPLTNDLQGDCASGITSGNIGGKKEWLVGDVFLKNVYFATDVARNVIGLAPQIAVGSASTAGSNTAAANGNAAAGSAASTGNAAAASNTAASKKLRRKHLRKDDN